MAGDLAFRASSRILSAKRKHVTAMAAPISTEVCYWRETMGNAVIDLLFISILIEWLAEDVKFIE